MRKSFLRKASIVLLSATMLMATACNKEIEVKYDYNVNDYVHIELNDNTFITLRLIKISYNPCDLDESMEI